MPALGSSGKYLSKPEFPSGRSLDASGFLHQGNKEDDEYCCGPMPAPKPIT